MVRVDARPGTATLHERIYWRPNSPIVRVAKYDVAANLVSNEKRPWPELVGLTHGGLPGSEIRSITRPTS